jgi:hypothetical protein
MQQEKERKNQAIEQVRMECFMCDKYLHVDIMKTKKETEKKREMFLFSQGSWLWRIHCWMMIII